MSSDQVKYVLQAHLLIKMPFILTAVSNISKEVMEILSNPLLSERHTGGDVVIISQRNCVIVSFGAMD